MVEKRMELLREELNRLIENQADFEKIQEVSALLDACLVEFYQQREQE